MEAACRGARSRGRDRPSGCCPGADREDANGWVVLALPTGLGEARNALIVRAADAVVAIGGGWGTLSEIALALRAGRAGRRRGDVGARRATARGRGRARRSRGRARRAVAERAASPCAETRHGFVAQPRAVPRARAPPSVRPPCADLTPRQLALCVAALARARASCSALRPAGRRAAAARRRAPRRAPARSRSGAAPAGGGRVRRARRGRGPAARRLPAARRARASTTRSARGRRDARAPTSAALNLAAKVEDGRQVLVPERRRAARGRRRRRRAGGAGAGGAGAAGQPEHGDARAARHAAGRRAGDRAEDPRLPRGARRLRLRRGARPRSRASARSGWPRCARQVTV